MIRARFRVDLKKVAQNIEAKAVDVQQKIALQLLTGFVMLTPVLSGRAKGNWQVTIGSAATSYDNSKMDKGGESTISAGGATIDQFTRPGAIYITNNLPYILPLEKGSSKQAPTGMVQLTLDRVSAQFE